MAVTAERSTFKMRRPDTILDRKKTTFLKVIITPISQNSKKMTKKALLSQPHISPQHIYTQGLLRVFVAIWKTKFFQIHTETIICKWKLRLKVLKNQSNTNRSRRLGGINCSFLIFVYLGVAIILRSFRLVLERRENTKIRIRLSCLISINKFGRFKTLFVRITNFFEHGQIICKLSKQWQKHKYVNTLEMDKISRIPAEEG